jgi:hypothetical protein
MNFLKNNDSISTKNIFLLGVLLQDLNKNVIFYSTNNDSFHIEEKHVIDNEVLSKDTINIYWHYFSFFGYKGPLPYMITDKYNDKSVDSFLLNKIFNELFINNMAHKLLDFKRRSSFVFSDISYSSLFMKNFSSTLMNSSLFSTLHETLSLTKIKRKIPIVSKKSILKNIYLKTGIILGKNTIISCYCLINDIHFNNREKKDINFTKEFPSYSILKKYYYKFPVLL